MAGQVRHGLVLALAWAFFAAGASAQTASPEPSAPPKEGKHTNWSAGGHPGEVGGPAYENVRKALEALTPEQRKRFQENFLRWSNLSPEEKKALRDREELRKRTIEQEVDAAIQESGLQLDPERREQFARRYGEGRRQIEEQLRKELNEKRKPLVRELLNRLRAEFASDAPLPSPPPSSQSIQTVSPTVPPKP